MRYTVLTSTLFLFIVAAADGSTVNQTQFPPTYIPLGQEMYKQFCAACHGADAKGDGPAASNLKTRPSDLTTLAKRHDGKFPYDYVSTMLRFGPGVPAHGSSNMPTWGPIFSIIEKSNEKAVQERVKRLSAFLASLQEK
jgi:mono/diheme cytochrome c family protein